MAKRRVRCEAVRLRRFRGVFAAGLEIVLEHDVSGLVPGDLLDQFERALGQRCEVASSVRIFSGETDRWRSWRPS